MAGLYYGGPVGWQTPAGIAAADPPSRRDTSSLAPDRREHRPHRARILWEVFATAMVVLGVLGVDAQAQQGWSRLVSTVAASTQSAPGLALDGAGNLTAVWRTDARAVMASRLPAGSNSWGPPVELSPVGQNGLSSQVAIVADAEGNVFAAWERMFPQGIAVQAARYSIQTGTWSVAVTVSAVDDVGPTVHGVLPDQAGNATIWWSQPVIQGAGIWSTVQAVRYQAASNAWGAVADLSSLGPQWGTPRAAADAAGNVTLAWIQEALVSTTAPFIIQSSRFAVNDDAWAAAVDVSPVIGHAPFAIPHLWGLVADSAGHATVAWTRPGESVSDLRRTVQAARYRADSGTWSAAVDVSTHVDDSSFVSIEGRVVVDQAGDATAVWIARRLDQPAVPPLVWAARSSAGSAAWTVPQPIADRARAGGPPMVVVDDEGRVTASWSSGSSGYASQYLPATGGWTPPVATPPESRIVADRAGNIFVYVVDPFSVRVARYSVTTGALSGAESVLSSSAGWLLSYHVLVDAAGGATAVWSPCRLQGQPSVCSEVAIESTRWLPTPAAPRPGAVRAGGEMAAVGFEPPVTVDPAFVATNYDYSVDDGGIWTSRAPASTVSPLRIGGLSDGVTYRIRLRARNAAGPGAMSDAIVVTPEQAPEAPTGLTVLVQSGQSVTVGWTPPADGLPPTGYVLEGGTAAGEVLASLPTGSLAPRLTFAAPVGVYYIRVHAVSGFGWSAPSNEIRIFVNVPAPPSAPANLLGLVNDSGLALSWTNTFDGGSPTSLWLSVTGAVTTALPLPMTDTVTYVGVPPGTYTLSVLAANAGGVSLPSNEVTLTFPGPCSGVPEAPRGFQAWRLGAVIFVSWSAPVSGRAVTAYAVQVSGAYVGSFVTTDRTLSGAAAPGTYLISVRAANPCGAGPPTPTQRVTIP